MKTDTIAVKDYIDLSDASVGGSGSVKKMVPKRNCSQQVCGFILGRSIMISRAREREIAAEVFKHAFGASSTSPSRRVPFRSIIFKREQPVSLNV